ncbi:Mucin-associated surface protein (MASP) [Trypanosoma cruzi]|uniref:Mucin-associated surface protein (MASP) n=1 Tax=Trypanosoma cruzi TaxID=5693 RepID=A0A2V2W4A7_TRYCR|nr:Mucin-associated surface protein (MASP) [Trypanosoma cruzi]
MTMMMTGRVLLVCALCVLWCGAGGGGCSEPTQVSQDITSVNENGPKTDNDSSGGAGGGGKNGQSAQSQPAGVSVQGANEVGAALRTGTQAPETADAEKKNQTEKGKDSMVQNTDDEKKQVEENGANEEKEDRNKEEEDEEVEEDEEGEEEEEREEKEEDGTKGKEETMKGADTSTTEVISAGNEEQPSLSSGAARASNITNTNSTQTTGDDHPAADGAETAEGKQNENKDANPKETPVTAAAMKNTTATTGDSDGSTAVSHTTSPLLLLLLVVACAAAAAVVAA